MAHMDMPWVLTLQGLSPTEKLVLTVLTCHANRDQGNTTYVSQSTIAREAGMSRSSTKTVRTAMRRLEQMGVISTVGRVDEHGRQTSHMTTVHVGILPEPIGADNPIGVVNPHPSVQPQGFTTPITGAENPTNRDSNRGVLTTKEDSAREVENPEPPRIGGDSGATISDQLRAASRRAARLRSA